MPRRVLFLTALTAVAVVAVAIHRWARPDDVRPALEANWAATVTTLAGDGVAGVRDGVTTRARFSDPFAVAVAGGGTVYVADGGDAQSIRVITPEGYVATMARGFTAVSGLAVDAAGTVYVADTGDNAIKRVTRDGSVTPIATGLNGPIGLAIDPTGRVIVADTYNDRILAIERDGSIRTIASAGFDTPAGVAVDADGTIYVADTAHSSIQVIDPAGAVSTLDVLDLLHPIGIASSGAGDIYVTDERGRILEIGRRDGHTRVVAGSKSGFADGDGESARFRRPTGLAMAAPGKLIVADAGNALVRVVEAVSQRAWGPPASPLIRPHFDRDTFALQPLLWPVAPVDGPHEVAGTQGEARGGDGADRFHAGVDIRADAGVPVFAIRDGIVSAPVATDDFLSLNEWLRIGSTAYVHIRAGRDLRGRLVDNTRFVPTHDAAGKLTRVRVKRGARFQAGDVIGSVNPFNHVHLNIGWPGEEINPLRLRLTQFADTIAPTIAPNGVRLFDRAGSPLPKRKDGVIEVAGGVQIVVDAWDQADGNRPERRLGVYELGYQVLTADGTPAPGFELPRTTLRFDALSPDEEAPHIVYASGSGIPFYGRRVTRFLYVVTNTFNHGVAARDVWDTTLLPPGDYVLRVRVADTQGNATFATTRISKP